MGKDKSTKVASGKSSHDKSSDKVKNAAISKPVESSKANGKSDKKSKKTAPPPPPESDSESEDDDDTSEGSSESDSENEVEAKPKTNGSAATKTNGHAKPAVNGKTNDSSDDNESNSGSDSEGSEDKAPAKAGQTAAVNGADTAGSSDEDSDDASDSDSSEGSDTKSEVKSAPTQQKRKADTVDAPAAKKAKTSVPANATGNLFIGNLSWNVDEDWLAREFEEFGEIKGCRVVTDRESGRSKGFGYVEFANVEDAVNAITAKKDAELDGRAMNVDYSVPRDQNASAGNNRDRADSRANKFGDSTSSPSNTLWVGNIAFSATAEAFQEAFGEYGTVTRVSLPTDRESGALKGFGYVDYASLDEAKAAYEGMKGYEMEGRALRLDYASARPDNGGDRGGGFRGRGGGRGDFGGRGGGRGFGGGDRGRGGRGGGRGRGGDRGGRGRGNFSTNRGMSDLCLDR